MTNYLKSGFDGASLKVARAYRHIDELKATLDNIRRDHPKTLIPKKQADGSFTLTFSDLGPSGPMIPLILGDAIHNLRSAFDHMWVALAEAAEPARANVAAVKFATFPFHETRHNLKGVVEKGAIKDAFPDTERLILDHIRPYSDAGGNEILWAITKFDKIDKHNTIIPIVEMNAIDHAIVKFGNIRGKFTDIGLDSGAIAFDGPIEIEDEAVLSFEIRFPAGGVLGKKAVLETLLDMAKSSDEAVQLFRKTFL